MLEDRSIVVNGDLGSGKSTVSVELAKRLGLRRISIGDLYREMAQQRGMTALQLNLHAELDDAVDGTVDRLQQEIADSGEQLMVDSRLAWFFFTEAFKVHLITDPVVAAQRVLARPSSEVEHYSSLSEAKERLHSRSESERARFLARYGADKYILRNYNVVCDTSHATPGEIADLIIASLDGAFGREILFESPPLLLLDPVRIYPTADVRNLDGIWSPQFVESVAGAGPAGIEPITLGYADFRFFVLDGHRRLSAALQNGFHLIPARLAAEGAEEVTAGSAALPYFESTVTADVISAWSEAHKVDLTIPAHLTASASAPAV
jgi:cytidylate kinase